MKKAVTTGDVRGDDLIRAARQAQADEASGPDARSDQAFLAVLAMAQQAGATPVDLVVGREEAPVLRTAGVGTARTHIGQRGRQFRLELLADSRDFADWLEREAPRLITELHERWTRSED